MAKNKVIIIEGAQGTGKSTLTALLREQMPYTNLLRLSGTSDKTKAGLDKVFKARNNELNMIVNSAGCDVNYILDRCHISESVYCKLGYKEYTFEKERIKLNDKLNTIANLYDVYVLVLTTTSDEFESRLKRNKPEFLNLKFNTESSNRQQDAYLAEMRSIKRKYNNINCFEVLTTNRDPYDIAYDILSVVKD